MSDRTKGRNIDFEGSNTHKDEEITRVSHLVDVLQFVNDLIYYRVSSLHFHFGVGTLSFDSVADHTEGVAVNRGQKGL